MLVSCSSASSLPPCAIESATGAASPDRITSVSSLARADDFLELFLDDDADLGDLLPLSITLPFNEVLECLTLVISSHIGACLSCFATERWEEELLGVLCAEWNVASRLCERKLSNEAFREIGRE